MCITIILINVISVGLSFIGLKRPRKLVNNINGVKSEELILDLKVFIVCLIFFNNNIGVNFYNIINNSINIRLKRVNANPPILAQFKIKIIFIKKEKLSFMYRFNF
jgi:hypothetical protein